MKKLEDIISGMGVAMSIVMALVKAIKRAGGNDALIHSLATPEGEAIMDGWARSLVHPKAFFGEWIVALRSLVVNSGLRASDEFFENVIVTPQELADARPEKVEFVRTIDLTENHWKCCNDGGLYRSEILELIARAGYRPATLVEMLLWWGENKEEEKKSELKKWFYSLASIDRGGYSISIEGGISLRSRKGATCDKFATHHMIPVVKK